MNPLTLAFWPRAFQLCIVVIAATGMRTSYTSQLKRQKGCAVAMRPNLAMIDESSHESSGKRSDKNSGNGIWWPHTFKDDWCGEGAPLIIPECGEGAPLIIPDGGEGAPLIIPDGGEDTA